MVAIKKANKTVARRSRGEGSLKQQKSGMWVGQIELPDDPRFPGVRQRAKVRSMDYDTCMTKFEAAKVQKITRGTVITSGDTVAEWMIYWLDRVDKSRPSTRATYRSSIRLYIIPAIGHVKLRFLDADDVDALETFIVKKKGLSTTTALQSYRVLSRALSYAERRRKIDVNVARHVDPPRRAVTNLKTLSTEEGISVIRSVTDARLGSRWAAALLTGARQGELLGLEIDRVDFQNNEIDVSWQLQRVDWRHGDGCPAVGVDDKGNDLYTCGRKRGTDCPSRKLDAPADWEHRYITGALYWSRPKSGAGWRIIPLVEPLRSILARRIAESTTEPNPYGLVWTADSKQTRGGTHKTVRRFLPLDGSPVDPSRDNAAWHRVLLNAPHRDDDGEPATVTDVRLHDARHTAVTILYDLGIPETLIQDIVGQSTVITTRSYRSKSKAQRALLADALGALGRELTAALAAPALPPGQEPPLALEAA